MSFQTSFLYLSAYNLEYFFAYSVLPLDILLPERADFAVRLEINLVILETDTNFTSSAMLMVNEEHAILLLCFRSTCLSLIQEPDNETSNYYD